MIKIWSSMAIAAWVCWAGNFDCSASVYQEPSCLLQLAQGGSRGLRASEPDAGLDLEEERTPAFESQTPVEAR